MRVSPLSPMLLAEEESRGFSLGRRKKKYRATRRRRKKMPEGLLSSIVYVAVMFTV